MGAQYRECTFVQEGLLYDCIVNIYYSMRLDNK